MIHSARKAVGISTKNLTFYKEHEDVSMMFSDLVGFTSLSAKIHPRTALVMLHSFFSSLDLVTSYLRIFKYETVGDAFITASNLLRKEPEHHVSALKMGVTLISVARDMSECPGHDFISEGRDSLAVADTPSSTPRQRGA